MRQQTKPFIVEIKQSRKLKTNTQKPSIWGNLDLSTTPHDASSADPGVEPAAADVGDRT